MAAGKIAFRYAKAIFDSFSKKESVLATVTKELKAMGELVDSHPDLKALAHSEAFSDAEKRGVVEDLVAKLGFSAETKRVLIVLSEMKRLSALSGIADRLQVLALNAANVVPMRVESSSALEDADRAKVENKFSHVLGKKVEATYHVDPGLLGGLKVTAGSRTFDGSIEGWLVELEERLMGGSH